MGRPSRVASALLLGAATSICALLGAPHAEADTTEKDRQFLSALQAIGWKITNPAKLTSQANLVCNEGLAHGVSVLEMRNALTELGYSSRDATALIDNAVRVYCPKYSNALLGEGPTKPAGPTYADGEEFTNEVYGRGILWDIHPSHMEQILANICYQASLGSPPNYLVGLHMDGYDLSEKDAKWLVSTALNKCD